jgi:hypothetical protein
MPDVTGKASASQNYKRDRQLSAGRQAIKSRPSRFAGKVACTPGGNAKTRHPRHFTTAKMNELQKKFDREMFIDALIELADKYAFRFPAITNQLVKIAGEMKTNMVQKNEQNELPNLQKRQ